MEAVQQSTSNDVHMEQRLGPSNQAPAESSRVADSGKTVTPERFVMFKLS